MTLTEEESNNRRILHERAVALAREPLNDGDHGEGIDVTVFRLGNELYALESRAIREIVPLRGAVALPCVPPVIAGIMNLRGRILSLLDLHRLLGLPGEGCGADFKVIVLSGEGMEFGLLSDSVEGVQNIPLASLQTELPAIEWSGEKYLLGVTAGRLILLDGFKLLNDPSLVVNEALE